MLPLALVVLEAVGKLPTQLEDWAQQVKAITVVLQ
jgi:hypothetical protein